MEGRQRMVETQREDLPIGADAPARDADLFLDVDHGPDAIELLLGDEVGMLEFQGIVEINAGQFGWNYHVQIESKTVLKWNP